MRCHYCWLFPLFVLVMSISGKNEHNDLRVVYLIHEAMFLRDMAAPLIGAVTTQLFRMACACTRMLTQLSFKF